MRACIGGAGKVVSRACVGHRLGYIVARSRECERRQRRNGRGQSEGRTWNERNDSRSVAELFPRGSYFRKL